MTDTDSSQPASTHPRTATSPDVPGRHALSPVDRHPPTARPTGARRTVRFVLKEIVLPLGLAVVLALVIQATVAKPYEIPTESMNPTIKPSERVLANRFIYHLRDVHRGDIVVFDPPASLNSTVPFVKRVIGLPGDTVQVTGGPDAGERATVRRRRRGRARVRVRADASSPRGCSSCWATTATTASTATCGASCRAKSVLGEVFMTYWPLTRLRRL